MSTESNQRAYKLVHNDDHGALNYIIGYSSAMMMSCNEGELESLSKEAIIELYHKSAECINKIARSGLGEKIDA